jgi:hypothetical protein
MRIIDVIDNNTSVLSTNVYDTNKAFYNLMGINSADDFIAQVNEIGSAFENRMLTDYVYFK